MSVFCTPLVGLLLFIPTAAAAAAATPMDFPDLSFTLFNDFISKNFGSDISLATVLTILFSLLENPDLINLHARQQIAKLPVSENSIGP